MTLTLNLQKAEQSLKLSLVKKGINTPPSVELQFILDVSGSFDDEHRSGITNDLLTRLVPWGLTFDPDKKLDVSTFSSGEQSVHAVGAVTASNYENFVQNKIINKVPGYGYGTDYSYALEAALKTFGWIPSEKKAGFFGKLLGKKDEQTAKRLAAVLFVTDGSNSDQLRTDQVLSESQARGDKVYFIFIGISNQPTEFRFIEELGRKYPNVGFIQIRDLKKFVNLSDDEINEQLITDEFATWLKT